MTLSTHLLFFYVRPHLVTSDWLNEALTKAFRLHKFSIYIQCLYTQNTFKKKYVSLRCFREMMKYSWYAEFSNPRKNHLRSSFDHRLQPVYNLMTCCCWCMLFSILFSLPSFVFTGTACELKDYYFGTLQRATMYVLKENFELFLYQVNMFVILQVVHLFLTSFR